MSGPSGPRFHDEEGRPFFSMGLATAKVYFSMHAENRSKLCAAMGAKGHGAGCVLLRGGAAGMRHDSDHELLFRQESWFNWAFGVLEPDWSGAIDLETGEATLFMPRLPASFAVWMGAILPPSFFRERYGVDRVLFGDARDAWISARYGEASVHVLYGKNSDSGTFSAPAVLAAAAPAASPTIVRDALYPVFAYCRVVKSAAELELMRYVSKVTSEAHVAVMRAAKPGMAEYQLESLFQHHIYTNGGCRRVAYTNICACGPNSAVLHYGHAGAPNDRIVGEGDMALIDMGAEYHCYCSDITCSYPIRGTFDATQRWVYNAVLDAQRAVMGAMKPGADWAALHRLAERTILAALLEQGVLVGDLDEIVDAKCGAIFLPCGMGHLIGCDTHDVGGYLDDTPPRNMTASGMGIAKLRTARILEEGMLLTVEPGLYFIDALLDTALASATQAQFFVAERVDALRSFGGVRLEDVVAVTSTGIANYTLTPRTCAEVESVMAGGVWPPAAGVDEAPWLCRAWY